MNFLSGLLNSIGSIFHQGAPAPQLAQQQPTMIKDQDGNLVPMPNQGAQNALNPNASPQQQQLPQLPGGWLNVFSAVRGMNEARQHQQQINDQEQQQQFANKITARGDTRDQEQFDEGRAQRTTIAGLGALTNMFDSISNDPSYTDPADRQAAYGAAFDRIAPALQAAGMDPTRLDGLRQQLTEHPEAASDLLSGLQSAVGQGGTQGLQAAIGPDGQPVFLDPRTRRPVARGYAPANTVLGVERNAQGTERLGLQEHQADLGYVEQRGEATARGRAIGTAAANAPQAQAAIETQLSGVQNLNGVLDNVDQYLATQPHDDNVLTTNARRAAAHVPGTPEADYAANLEQLKHALSLYDLRSLRQSGLTLGRTNLAEFQAASQAVANLSLSQTVGQQRQAIDNVRTYVQHVQQSLTDERQHAIDLQNPDHAAPAAAPANPAAPAAAPASAPLPANDPRARRSGETTDQYLTRLGL